MISSDILTTMKLRHTRNFSYYTALGNRLNMDDPNTDEDDGGVVKLSINVNSFTEYETYTTSDGQRYVPLQINLQALEKILRGERAVTTIVQFQR